jgi:GH25 family lysozyme M1 (1,4-beta-N-acetylmuramidase)
MDLAAAGAAGISFFVHKATEGTTYQDEYYVEAMNRARSARIPVMGAYHALWPDDPIADARAFFEHVDRTTPWWREVPWIWQGDFEKFGPREPNHDECITFLDELKRLTKGKGYIIAYAPRWLYGNALDPFPYDFWASNYTGSGAPRPFREQYQGIPQSSWETYSGRPPRILQFASDAVTGTQPTTCVDRFNGTLADLIALANVTATEPVMLKPATSRAKPRTARQPSTGRTKPRTTKKQPSGEPVGARRKGMTAGRTRAGAAPAKKATRPSTARPAKTTAKKKAAKASKKA